MQAFYFVIAVLEFIIELVSSYFDCSSIKIIVVDNVFLCTSESEEDAVIGKRMHPSCGSMWLLDSDWGAKRPHMFEVWFAASPSFILWHLFDAFVVPLIEDITCMHEGIAP